MQNGFGSPAFYVQTARRVDSADAAIEFLKELEYLGNNKKSVNPLICELRIS